MAKARECNFSLTETDEFGEYVGDGTGQLILLSNEAEELVARDTFGFQTTIVRLKPVNGGKPINDLVAFPDLEEGEIIPFGSRKDADRYAQEITRLASLPHTRK